GCGGRGHCEHHYTACAPAVPARWVESTSVVVRTEDDCALGALPVIPVFDLTGALYDRRDRAHAQLVELYGPAAARCLYIKRSLAGRMSSWHVWRETSLCLVPEYVLAAKPTWLCASAELVQLGARDTASEVPPGQQ
ncbi:hypothetical protein JG688_00017027, partial [Phytophthora aleatoria]